MAITASHVETAVEALVTALTAGDYATAKLNAVKVRALLIAMPDYGVGDRNVRWSRSEITDLIKSIDVIAGESTSAVCGRTTYAGQVRE